MKAARLAVLAFAAGLTGFMTFAQEAATPKAGTPAVSAEEHVELVARELEPLMAQPPESLFKEGQRLAFRVKAGSYNVGLARNVAEFERLLEERGEFLDLAEDTLRGHESIKKMGLDEIERILEERKTPQANAKAYRLGKKLEEKLLKKKAEENEYREWVAEIDERLEELKDQRGDLERDKRLTEMGLDSDRPSRAHAARPWRKRKTQKHEPPKPEPHEDIAELLKRLKDQ